jgi:hypothetical protein
MFRKHRGKVLQLIDIIWPAYKRERRLSRLLKIAIVDLETLHRGKSSGQNIEDLRIKSQRCRENRNASDRERRYAAPNQGAPLRHDLGDEVADAHESGLVFCNSDGFTMAGHDCSHLRPVFV